ncbi:hypothetical protein MBLNU459_g3096t1 [Dothideomycetes sp. NU459]
MGQPRPGRKKVVVVSSDVEEENAKPRTRNRKLLGAAEARKAATKAHAVSTSIARSASQTSPSQANKRKARSKQAMEPESKRGNKSIFSFFNAATQRQQGPQRSVSPDKSIASSHDYEDIQDAVSGDESSATLSKGSQTALAMRKRKLHHDPFLGSDGITAPSATQKFRKISDGTKVPGKAAEERRPWTEQFAPLDLSELAVHRKKISDVREVLESALSERARPRLIVLKGAAGTGKTTTVNLLARDLGVEAKEWRNPAGADASSSTSVSASAQFEDFILRSGRFAGLELVSSDGSSTKSKSETDSTGIQTRSQIMLVEEFPNTFAKTSGALQAFRATIQQFLATARLPHSNPTPLVMIISETLLSTSTASADSFTAHRLLGPQILSNPQTAEIEFNAVAPTILTKALETVVVKEARKSGRRKTPGPAVLKRLAEIGDVRSAVSSLEFLCLRGDEGDSWSAKVAFTKPKRGSGRDTPLTKQEQDALELIGSRESSLGIFHAVGKVVYNKRSPATTSIPQPPNHLPQHRKPRPAEVDVDVLINELGTDTNTFVAALHENYVLSCTSSSSEDALDALNGCIDALSDADLLSPDRFGVGTRAFSGSALDNLRQDDLSFQAAVRGLLFALPEKVQRASSGGGAKGGAAFRMFYPQSLKLWRSREEIDSDLDLVISTLQSATGTGSDGVSRKEGVESWRRNNVFDTPSLSSLDLAVQDDGPSGPSTALSTLGSSARTEMLLDRLPYMLQILSCSSSTSSSLLKQIAKLTIVSGTTGSGPRSLEDGDAGADADGEGIADPLVSEWTTDRPDGEVEEPRPKWERRNKGVTGKRMPVKDEREGEGLGIPVEHAVERLVLSDDDIVDD